MATGNSSLVASESQTTNCLASFLAASGQLQHGDASPEFMAGGLWASQSFRVPEPAGVLPQTPSTASLQHDIHRGGVVEPFPWKLHRMLEETQLAGKGHIASYFAHGRAFAIHKPEVFVREIMPLYFRQSKMTSLNRQLNLYGFHRINSGPDKGGYYHDLFLQGRPQLCDKMRRTKIKGTSRGNDNRSDCPEYVQHRRVPYGSFIVCDDLTFFVFPLVSMRIQPCELKVFFARPHPTWIVSHHPFRAPGMWS
jgi:hypothetical protein